MLFKRKKVVDERVKNMQNKIYREIYTIVSFICLLSIIVKFFNHGFELNHVTTECIILIVAGFYYTYRSSQTGLFSAEIEMHNTNNKFSYNTKTIIIGAITGLLIAVGMGLNSAYNYADSTGQAISYFFVVFFVSLVIYTPIMIVLLMISVKSAEKKSDSVNKKLLEEE